MQKNLPNSAMKIIDSEKTDHCLIHAIAYNAKDEMVAESFAESDEEVDEMVNKLRGYARIEFVKIPITDASNDTEALFLEEEIIQAQIDELHAPKIRFPESSLISWQPISSIR